MTGAKLHRFMASLLMFHLYIIGDGDSKETSDMTRTLKRRVTLLQQFVYISNTVGTFALRKICHLYIFLSVNESFSFCIIETISFCIAKNVSFCIDENCCFHDAL